MLTALSLDHDGAITLEGLDTVLSDAADTAEEAAPGRVRSTRRHQPCRDRRRRRVQPAGEPALPQAQTHRTAAVQRLIGQGSPSIRLAVASTMVTVIALLLGLAVVALQLASTQFSPRLLRNFLRDRPNQIVLGVFVGTFAYSTAGLFTVGVAGGQRVDQSLA